MRRFFFAWSFAALVCFTSVLTAQETFTDSAEFEAALSDTASIVCEDFSELTDLSGFGGDIGSILAELPTPQMLPFGTLTTDSQISEEFSQLISAPGNILVLGNDLPSGGGGGFGPDVDFGDSFAVTGLFLSNEEDNPTTIALDPTLGDVEGLCFEYSVATGFCFTVFDGDTVVDTIVAPDFMADGELPSIFDLAEPAAETAVFCWSNSSQANVTRVEIKGFVVLTSAKFAFGDFEPSCQDLLQDVIDALIVKREFANPYDQVWIDEAILELELAQSPDLWETGNLLSDYGKIFFGHNFYATYYLQCVSDSYLVADCLVGIQDLLGCVVDAEIDFAMENPDVRSNLLDYAEYFESFADAFADAELYLDAVVLYFYAWLFANNA